MDCADSTSQSYASSYWMMLKSPPSWYCNLILHKWCLEMSSNLLKSLFCVQQRKIWLQKEMFLLYYPFHIWTNDPSQSTFANHFLTIITELSTLLLLRCWYDKCLSLCFIVCDLLSLPLMSSANPFVDKTQSTPIIRNPELIDVSKTRYTLRLG